MRKAVAGLLIGLGAGLLLLVADAAFDRASGGTGINPLETVELKTYDWRLARTARPDLASPDIALVEIDESSLRNLEPNVGRWPWPRVVHSSLIDYLARAPAKVIVYDVLFTDPDKTVGFQYGGDTWSGRQSDRALVDSVKAAGNVLVPADATYDSESAQLPETGFALDVPGIEDRRGIRAPFEALAGAASGLGHNLLDLDPDGPVRRVVPFVRAQGRALPSLGVAAALRFADIPPSKVRLEGARLRIGDREMPLASRRVEREDGIARYLSALIDFRGPALSPDLKTHTYRTYTFWDLLVSEEQLLADQKPNVDPSMFRGKLVFVGVTASGLADVFETPFAHGKMPGIQVHAAVADDILSNRFIRRAGGVLRAVTLFGLALLVGLIATTMPAWWATGAALAIAAVFGWTSARLLANGVWLNLTQPVVASACALFGGVAYQYFVEGREKRQVKRLFGQYVSKDVYERLVADPALARLGGQLREMTVLFSDIRGFTTVSERDRPEEIVGMLNEYFTGMVDIVFRHRGTVDKFVGDMVMALFGAPLDDPDHAGHALDAALDMIAALESLNARWQAQGRTRLEIGIGINTGPMIAGNIGSEAIMSYTVIGDAVNLGSRLESLNKEYGTRIIISDTVRQNLTRPYALRPLGDVVVKGKTLPVAIFSVEGRA